MPTKRVNNPRAFADVISIEAWRSKYDETSGYADLFIAIAFSDGGRIGSGDDPVRFHMSLKRAEVHVVLDVGGLLSIRRGTVARHEPPTQMVKRSVEGAKGKNVEGDASIGSGGVNLTASFGERDSVNVTDSWEEERNPFGLKVSPWNTSEGFAFKIGPGPNHDRLVGVPWKASERRMVIIDKGRDRLHGIPPEAVVEIRCRREDLIIEDIVFPNKKFTWAKLPKSKKMVINEYIRKEIQSMGFDCGLLEDGFANLMLADMVTEEGN